MAVQSMACVVSVNISKEKGVCKQPVSTIELGDHGIVGDAHAGHWHRQVSLLSQESIAAFSGKSSRAYRPGEFAENITTAGINLAQLRILDKLFIGDVVLEISQIGKQCHGGGCAIFREVGKCVMPKEGLFARVVRGGRIEVGCEIRHEARPIRVGVVVLSDRASAGVYSDRSGPVVEQRMRDHFEGGLLWGFESEYVLIPDDAARLGSVLSEMRARGVDIVLTCGGTGIGPRDITPDVVQPLLTKALPGIMESIRVKYGATIPSAVLSRSVAGLMGSTLVYTLPGSVKAVHEYLDEILRSLNHALCMLHGFDTH
jgi:molybdopterin adenylyltransferase